MTYVITAHFNPGDRIETRTAETDVDAYTAAKQFEPTASAVTISDGESSWGVVEFYRAFSTRINA